MSWVARQGQCQTIPGLVPHTPCPRACDHKSVAYSGVAREYPSRDGSGTTTLVIGACGSLSSAVAVRWTFAQRGVFLPEHGCGLARDRASCRAVSVWGTKGQTKLVLFRRGRQRRYESNQDEKGNLVLDSLPPWIEHRKLLSGKERRVLPQRGPTFDALGAFPLPCTYGRDQRTSLSPHVKNLILSSNLGDFDRD